MSSYDEEMGMLTLTLTLVGIIAVTVWFLAFSSGKKHGMINVASGQYECIKAFDEYVCRKKEGRL